MRVVVVGFLQKRLSWGDPPANEVERNDAEMRRKRREIFLRSMRPMLERLMNIFSKMLFFSFKREPFYNAKTICFTWSAGSLRDKLNILIRVL